VRLTVHRSNSHIYAQVIDATGDKVLASASTLEKDVRASSRTAATGRPRAGRQAHRREGEARPGIEQVAFDRAGFRYHGRVKALAEAAREAGLKF
jgi:large subunit ribosomal protein L18